MNNQSQHFNYSLMLRVFLPDDLITQILSFLPVRSLLQLRCVCKSWKTVFSEPTFIKLHLHRSAKNPQIILTSTISTDIRIMPFPVHRLLDNTTSITILHNFRFQLNDIGYYQVVSSSNGLLCMLVYDSCPSFDQILFYLWNTTSRKLSNKIVFLHHCPRKLLKNPFRSWKFSFGYDISSDTYNIVASSLTGRVVKVFTSGGDDVWRNIQSFPLVPCDYNIGSNRGISDHVHVCGALNWLAIRDLFSLDLSTETFRPFQTPRGFDEVPQLEPILVVLIDSLCFCHDFHGTHLVIWQMKKFGVEES